MHGATVGRALGWQRVYVPRHAGAFCALGMLDSDIRHDPYRVFDAPLGEEAMATVPAAFAELATAALEEVGAEAAASTTSPPSRHASKPSIAASSATSSRSRPFALPRCAWWLQHPRQAHHCRRQPDHRLHRHRPADVLYHWNALSGAGAVAERDGFHQVGLLGALGGLTVPNVEAYERLYPIRIHRHEIRCDSAGPGERRGGARVEVDGVTGAVDATATVRLRLAEAAE